jgi:hypothetical protein
MNVVATGKRWPFRWGLDNGQYGETGNAKISPSGQVCNWRYLNLNFNKKVGID